MKKLYILPFLIFLLIAFFLWRGLSLNPKQIPSAKVGKPLPVMQLLSLHDNKPHFILDEFSNEYFLINIWASWCSSCFEEHAFLLKLAKNGIPIYGINYKDSRSSAKELLATWDNPYRNTGLDYSGKVAIELGVYGAPETFLVDNKGIILHRYAGVLNDKIWQKEFLPLIKSRNYS